MADSSVSFAVRTDTAFELRKHAIRVANELITQGAKPGDCVMLVFPPSLEAMVAFWGCIYAGVISVPVMPPDPTQPAVRLRFHAAPGVFETHFRTPLIKPSILLFNRETYLALMLW